MKSLSNEGANSIIAQVGAKKEAQFSESCKIVENYLKLRHLPIKYGEKGKKQRFFAVVQGSGRGAELLKATVRR